MPAEPKDAFPLEVACLRRHWAREISLCRRAQHECDLRERHLEIVLDSKSLEASISSNARVGPSTPLLNFSGRMDGVRWRTRLRGEADLPYLCRAHSTDGRPWIVGWCLRLQLKNERRCRPEERLRETISPANF